MTDETVRAEETEDGLIDEARLVRLAKEGDLTAYGELVRQYQGRLYAMIYNMTGNRQDAEDLVQDVFLRAHRALKRFRGQSSFYTWIYRIARNTTINFLKKRSRHAVVSYDDVDQGVERDPDYVDLSARSTPIRDASLSELQEKLNAALQTLSEKHRSVVVLHDIQGVPHEEIAAMQSCSPGTIRSRLFYARRQLQLELKDYAP
jgi:RNA polymerase sigma factor (sigma-70 family)